MFGNSAAGPSRERDGGHRTRFEPSRTSNLWAKIRKQLAPATHPSTTSQSAHESGFHTDTDIFFLETNNHLPLELLDPVAAHNRKRKGSAGGGGLLKGRKSDVKARKSSAGISGSRFGDEDEGSCEPVSCVVVENDFDKFKPHLDKSDSGSTRTAGGRSGNNTPSARIGLGGRTSLFGKSEEDNDEDSLDGGGNGGRRRSGVDDLDITSSKTKRGRERNWLQRSKAYEILVERIWPNFRHFLNSSYTEPSKERSFIKEAWFQQKTTAMASSVFFLISWALTAGLQPAFSTFVIVTYCVLGSVFTVPLFPLIAFDYPRRHNWIYQPVLFCATWILADALVIEAYHCGFFTTNNRCGSKNFINMLGAAFAQPVLSLLAMRQDRAWALLGAVQWMILAAVLLMTQDNSPTLFYRNMVNFALFHAFIIGASFLKERSDRAMFAMRQQLKMQYRATQSAQVMERKASDSKKRFVSYIFHEVRVPLNTALLAVQNLEGEHVFKAVPEDQAEMVHGLMRSLTTMEKVLNDVLSFNRMEAGRFTQARKPFEFHKAIGLVALSHRAQAQANGIELIVELDKDIDKIGGVFMGDEMRLRQITSNLVSNSIKFTERGSVRIVTKLLYPRLEPTPGMEIDDPLREAAINLQKQQEMEEATRRESVDLEKDRITPPKSHGDLEKGSIHLETQRQSGEFKRPPSGAGSAAMRDKDREPPKAVIRVEVHDTGVGLKKIDLEDQRLFSPYVQTEIGRRQGGKGSGLGLALIRQIVRLSSGRLGVDSEYGKGSMFWFELPYAFPPAPKPRSRESTSTAGVSSIGGALGPGLRNPPLGPGKIAVIGEVDEAPDARAEGHLRPQMVETQSTAPLLRRGSTGLPHVSIPTDALMRTPFPPPSSSSVGSATASGSAASYRADLDLQHMMGEIPMSPIASPGGTGTVGGLSPLNFMGADRRDSEFTLGTMFTEDESRRGSEAPISPGGVEEEGRLCCLVVDDDKLTRMLMSRMLTRLGHTVRTAENGKIAVEMIKDSFEGGEEGTQPVFHVCFLDNQMPLMSGVEVARAVREMGNPLYVVACTGNALREDQDEFLSAGADGLIPKPIHQRAVLEQIKEARKRIKGETRPKPSMPFD